MSAAALTTPMIYIDCDVPEGQTLRDWRRARKAAHPVGTPMSSVLRRVRRTRRARRPQSAGARVLAPAL
ncbi:MAG: hypothetical protein ABI950_04400 [Solirubrobacteraceae bacterium]